MADVVEPRHQKQSAWVVSLHVKTVRQINKPRRQARKTLTGQVGNYPDRQAAGVEKGDRP
jgi:hypothetical protein